MIRSSFLVSVIWKLLLGKAIAAALLLQSIVFNMKLFVDYLQSFLKSTFSGIVDSRNFLLSCITQSFRHIKIRFINFYDYEEILPEDRARR